MKNYRNLIPIALIVLMLLSWYTLVSDAVSVNRAYESNLKQAREYAENRITKYAMEHYQAALAIQDTPEVWAEVAEYYKSINNKQEYQNWSEEFFEAHPTEPAAYDYLLDSYLLDEDYASCYDVLEIADRRGVSSKSIKQVRKDIEYKYKLDFSSYEDVRMYSNNYCAVQDDELWGFVDRFGNQRVGCKYPEVGAYTASAVAPVVNKDQEAYFIDKEGSRVLATRDPYKAFGNIVDGIFSAQKPNGKYVYLNEEFEVLFGDYDEATTFNNGVAAVKTGEKWILIDEDGKQIGKQSYLDVVLDDKKIACRNERLFVSVEKDKYIMIDSSGKQVGKLTFDDARLFAEDAPAAVKIGQTWCFVKTDGSKLSDKTYQEARSFSSGLAAVKIGGKWGFVNEKETVVIKPEFFDSRDFNAKGSCFVNTGDSWQLLKLYRLNREG